MPTYDYECTKCGHTFDAFQSMSDDPLKKCPNCGQNSLKRLIGGGLGVIFKGSGFYVTDSRSGSSSRSSSSSKKPDTTGESKSESGGTSEASPGSTSTSETKSTDKSKDSASSGKSTDSTAKVAG